jgi:hypothetical protein
MERSDGTLCEERPFPLGSLHMSGPYPLDDEVIDERVIRTSPGNYALGYLDGATFVVFFVGRSDSDVKARLHEWVGVPSRYRRYAAPTQAAWGARPCRRRRYAPALEQVGNEVESSYTCFAYSYASCALAAFEEECRNYRDFGGSQGLDNAFPPVSPALLGAVSEGRREAPVE